MRSKERAVCNFAERIAAERPMLVRVARRMLRNAAWAEDAVSETLVAALENPGAFAGRAEFCTWLVAILKHKAVDQIRHHTRECPAGARVEAPSPVDSSEFGSGATAAAQGRVDDPQERFARLQFVTQVDRCLRTLPPRQVRAFVMRNCLDRDTAEICAELGVTANNLAVLLHRANRRLRASLSQYR